MIDAMRRMDHTKKVLEIEIQSDYFASIHRQAHTFLEEICARGSEYSQLWSQIGGSYRATPSMFSGRYHT